MSPREIMTATVADLNARCTTIGKLLEEAERIPAPRSWIALIGAEIQQIKREVVRRAHVAPSSTPISG